MFRNVPRWLAVAILIGPGLVAALPLLCVAVAAFVAHQLGCRLDEGNVRPCVAWGIDIGPSLYRLGVMGWLGLVTIPLGIGLYLVLFVWWLVTAIVRRRSSSLSAPEK